MTTDGLTISQPLKDLINAEFNTSKGSYKPNDHPFFCVKCGGKSLTMSQAEACRALGHHVFKAMKCSGIYGYLQSEIKQIKDELNVDNVCAFSVNGYMIYFPKTRKLDSLSSNNVNNDINAKCCMTCGFDLKNRNEIKTDLFCSILCKLVFNNNDQLRAMVANAPASRNIVKLPLKRTSKKIKKKTQGDEKKNQSPNNPLEENNEILETLSAVAKNDGNKFSTNIFSLRKRSRKGVHRVPTRAALK